MAAVKNVPGIFAKIKTAGTPPKFSHSFLSETLGFTSSNDRRIIAVLKNLGFLNPDGVPTQRYADYRGVKGGSAISKGLREGWSEVFLADENANELNAKEIQAIMKGLTGKGDAVAEKLASTFKTLANLGDWTATDETVDDQVEDRGDDTPTEDPIEELRGEGEKGVEALGRQVKLHTDIHVHLPPTTDVSVYTAIFRAIRDELT